MGRGGVTCSLPNFGKTVVISQKRHKIATWLQRETIRKSYAAYRMVILPMPLSDPTPQMTYFGTLSPPFVSLAQVKLETSKSVYILTMASTSHCSQPMTCCPEVRRDHLNFWQKSGNISKTLYHSDMFTIGDYRMVPFLISYVVYRMVTLRMTLSDREPNLGNYRTDFV